MKPMGLTNEHNPTVKAYAVVQLRQDNALGTLYNMVGFQTKLKHGEQVRVFRTIPGLENAEFARLGGLHRNTYINSPTLLDGSLQLKSRPGLRFAGQITGCEGYVESAAIGLLAGRFAAAQRLGQPASTPPATTAFGALLNHITGGHIVSDDEPGKRSFQPMNVNFGLFPPLDAGTKLKPDGFEGRFRGKDKTLAKKKATTSRALRDCRAWLGLTPATAEAAE
jgi:methylenetetrahydrofolate--tRNA-(uracil-5-)-methyltransferase